MSYRLWTGSAGVALVLVFAASAGRAADVPGDRVFGGARVEEVYRVHLNRGDLLLESIMDVIKQRDIRDGAIVTGVGSLSECTYHWVTSTAATPEDARKTVREPMEILGMSGIIADGEPHIHISLSTPNGAFGGHLENGCRVLYLSEFTILKFSGPPLTRKPNAAGVGTLQEK